MNQRVWAKNESAEGSVRPSISTAGLAVVGILSMLGLLYCPVSPAQTNSPTPTPTFYKDVLPVLQRNCQSCHRPGEIAPMPLLDYESTRPFAGLIKDALQHRKMPPWFADPRYGKFANDRNLSEADLKTLVAWVDAGAPAGDPKEAPAPVQWTAGWRIGKPDIEYEMPNAFNVPASGVIEYQYVLIPTGFTEDKWVQMTEMRPGNRSVVHHANAFLRPPGSQWMADAKPGVVFLPSAAQNKSGIPGRDQYELLASYTPGLQPWICSPSAAKLVKAGSDIVLEIHYVSNGRATTDKTKFGLIFYKGQPVRRELTMSTSNSGFEIPAGALNYEVKSQFKVGGDSELVGLMPHMHLRGKDFSFKIVYPTGESNTALFVPHYDFHWQLYYVLEKPVVMPKGTRIECTAHYDNSANNPMNPDPTKNVRWGQQSWDEMMLGWLDITIPINADPSNFYHSRTDTRLYRLLSKRWLPSISALILLVLVAVVFIEFQRIRHTGFCGSDKAASARFGIARCGTHQSPNSRRHWKAQGAIQDGHNEPRRC